MAENDAQNQAVPTPNGGDQPTGPQFAIQRIYLKDASFESPRSPAAFQSKWSPRINFDIKTRSEKLQNDAFEVVLILTVEAQLEEKAVFLVEVHQAGIFIMKDFDPAQIELLIATVCPNILFPYAREAIDNFVVRGTFPALMLSPINFEMLYAQQKQKLAEQARAAGGANVAQAPTQ